ncbi:MAG TPA: hypothetical protein VF678_10160 [bacterium]
MEEQYKGRDFVVVKIHSPEFGWEKDRETVVKYAKRFNLTSPIYLDNDFAYWNALNNQYWPAFYLVDKKGSIRRQSAGEMHAGADPADSFQRDIARLLAEQG